MESKYKIQSSAKRCEIYDLPVKSYVLQHSLIMRSAKETLREESNPSYSLEYKNGK